MTWDSVTEKIPYFTKFINLRSPVFTWLKYFTTTKQRPQTGTSLFKQTDATAKSMLNTPGLVLRSHRQQNSNPHSIDSSCSLSPSALQLQSAPKHMTQIIHPGDTEARTNGIHLPQATKLLCCPMNLRWNKVV